MYKILYEDSANFCKQKKVTQVMFHRISHYLLPFISFLDTRLDIRLTRTFFDLFVSLLTFRHSSKSLLLSELGKYITGAEHCSAGTKRLSNLLRNEDWGSKDIEKILLTQAESYVGEYAAQGKRLLCFCDESMIEKHESWATEGLCPVYSSRAARLTHIKPGYYNKPSKRICVPGFEWTAMIIGGLGLVPCLGMMEWWTTKGTHKEYGDNIFYRMIKRAKAHFGDALTFVLDRGYANYRTIEQLTRHQQNFIIRWKSNLILINEQGQELNTWRMCKGQKSMDSRVIYDKERKKNAHAEIIYTKVFHPEQPDKKLTLIVVRNKTYKHQPPMYMLTSVEVDSIGIAWELFYSYIKRWDIEQTFRFNKCELGIQSCRLWKFENRLKMMALVTLVYDFLLLTWRNSKDTATAWINKWCHRTGKKLKEIKMPLYRLRAAFANVIELFLSQNSG